MCAENLNNFNLICFSCQNAYNCRYFKDSVWINWMYNHKDEGCPAMKYTYASIYEAYKLKEKEEQILKFDNLKERKSVFKEFYGN